MAGGGGSDSRWLVSYGDLVTLLMAFFVALYGISHADQDKFRKLLSGLGPFGNPAAGHDGILPGGDSVVGGSGNGVNGTAGEGAVGAEDAVARSASGVSATRGGDGGGIAAHEAGASELGEIRGRLESVARDAGIQSNVSFSVSQRGLVVSITTDDVLFRSGSSEIGDEGAAIIAVITPELQRLTNIVLIEGHTDNVPLRRPGYTNWNLSTDRAVAVVRMLQEDFGIDPARLVAVGYGEFRPRAPNDSAKGRARNRRVDIAITLGASNGKKDER